MASVTKNQLPWPTIHPQPSGNGAPIFSGVRVVELASIVAVPSVGRCFADLGAEVVKVEGPGGLGRGGDPVRSGTLSYESQYRKHRGLSMNFECLHLGKRSLCLDLKKDRRAFMALLRESDVLITNIRVHQLQAMQIEYEDLRKELPRLIVAHLTAWGRNGLDCELPGYDLSAFWSATGMAHAVHDPWMHEAYPGGFGDVTTGLSLIGAISLALSQRVHTGCGQLVTTSLYNTGIFCMAPILLDGQAIDNLTADTRILEHPAPVYGPRTAERTDPCNYVYASADGVHFAVLASPTDEDAIQRIQEILDIDTATVSRLRNIFATMEFTSILGRLQAAKIPVVRGSGFDELPSNHESMKDCFQAIQGIEDMPFVPKIPFDFSCSETHGPGHPAVALGAHNDAWHAHGWSPRHNGMIDRHPADTYCLKDFLIVELSEPNSSAIAACTRQLADAVPSATFVKIVDPEIGDYWLERHPNFAAHLSRGKREMRCAVSALANLICSLSGQGKAIVFVTNLEERVLESVRLDYANLSKRIPGFIMILLTPFGIGQREDARGELGGWYMGGPMPHLISGIRATQPKMIPNQLGDLCVSFAVSAAICAAIFHLVRTGEGQLAHVAANRAAVWSVIGVLPGYMASWDYNNYNRNGATASLEGKDWWQSMPPIMSSHHTKDGAWLVLTPVAKTLQSPAKFGFRLSGLTSFFGAILWNKISRSSETTMQAALRAVAKWRLTLQDKVGAMTFAEFQKYAAIRGIDWAPVLTSKDVLSCCQALAIGAIGVSTDKRAVVINSPVRFAASGSGSVILSHTLALEKIACAQTDTYSIRAKL